MRIMQMQAQQAAASQLPPGAPGAAQAGPGGLPPGLLSALNGAAGAAGATGHPGSPNAAAVQAAAAAAAAAAAGLPNTLSLQSLLAGIPTSGAPGLNPPGANLPHPAFASLLAQQKPGLFPEPPKKEDDHPAKTNGGKSVCLVFIRKGRRSGLFVPSAYGHSTWRMLCCLVSLHPLPPFGTSFLRLLPRFPSE